MNNELLLSSKERFSQPFFFCQHEIDTYLEEKKSKGISSAAIDKYRTPLQRLLRWLQDDQQLTKEKLGAWRKELETCGYGKLTVQAYVKVINNFLREKGRDDLCIPKPMQKDLTGKQFGYLTVLEPMDKRHRRDIVWRCRCRCGRETEVPAVLLLGGNTTSCGCLNVEILKHTNRYVDGTSLRQALEDKPISKNSISGYTGVQPKRDKWMAFINYKGVRYNLGTYSKIEDAVKARARAKEWVIEDAAKLYEETRHLYVDQPGRPPKPERQKTESTEPIKIRARRCDNTSGCVGVSLQSGKWLSTISYKGKRYRLGVYEDIEDAVTARKRAERYVMEGNLQQLEKLSLSPK